MTNLDRRAPGADGQLSNRAARGRSGYPGCVPLQRAHGEGLPAACSHSSSSSSSSSTSAPSLGPLLDTVQEANQEDVRRQVVHPAVHQNAALRAAELVPGADDVFQAAAAEGVLARQHLGRGVQALQAHRALQQIQQRRRLVHVGGEGEHLGFSVRGDAAATGSCTGEMSRGRRTFWEAASGTRHDRVPPRRALITGVLLKLSSADPYLSPSLPSTCFCFFLSLSLSLSPCLSLSLSLSLSPAAEQKAVRSRSHHHHHPRADQKCGARSRTTDRLIQTRRKRETTTPSSSTTTTTTHTHQQAGSLIIRFPPHTFTPELVSHLFRQTWEADGRFPVISPALRVLITQSPQL